MVSASDFGSGGSGFESSWRRNLPYDCKALHCTKPFIVTLPFPSSQFDLNNVERDVNTKISS